MSDYASIFQSAWELMQTDITIGEFTFSYADVFIFHSLVAFAFHAFWLLLGFSNKFDFGD